MFATSDDIRCAGESVELFFSTKYSDRDAAKILCNNCAVQEQCLNMAIKMEAQDSTKHRFGIFGGLTGGERKRLVAARKLQEEGSS